MKNMITSLSIFLFMTLTVSAGYSQTKEVTRITEEFLNELVENNRPFTKKGKVADYIPELSKANPDDIAIAVVDKNGKIIEAGDTDQKFTVQSISKLIGLMLAVE